MTRAAVTTQDLQKFFAAYGVAKPIDLSQSNNLGWRLRETVEGLIPQFVEAGTVALANDHIRLDQLKKVKGASARAFNTMARYDGKDPLSFYELALGLEKADLLRLPAGQSAATLWQDPASVRWGILKHDRQSELGDYLESRRKADAALGNALMVLDAWANERPSDFEGILSFDGRIIDIMLACHDYRIRDPFLALFQTPEETVGDNPIEGFQNLERDFESILSRLKTQDLGVIQALLKDSNPRKVAFGLLCAKRMLSKAQFTATCKNLLPGRSPLASATVYRTEKNSVTLGELAQELVQDRSIPIRLAGLD